jgi:hypothetical protein
MMSRPVQSNNCLWPMPLFAVDRARSVERCHHEMTNACFSFHLLLAECRSLMLASAIHEIRATFEPSHCETGIFAVLCFFSKSCACVRSCHPILVHAPTLGPHPIHVVHTSSMPTSHPSLHACAHSVNAKVRAPSLSTRCPCPHVLALPEQRHLDSQSVFPFI